MRLPSMAVRGASTNTAACAPAAVEVDGILRLRLEH